MRKFYQSWKQLNYPSFLKNRFDAHFEQCEINQEESEKLLTKLSTICQ